MVGESGTTLVCGPQRLSRRELLAIHTRTHALHTHTTRTRCCDGRAGLRSERDLRLTRTHTTQHARLARREQHHQTRSQAPEAGKTQRHDEAKNNATTGLGGTRAGATSAARDGGGSGGSRESKGAALGREEAGREKEQKRRRAPEATETTQSRAEQEGGEAGSQRSGLPCGRGCVALSVLPPLALLVAAAAETDHFPRAKPTRGLNHLPM